MIEQNEKSKKEQFIFYQKYPLLRYSLLFRNQLKLFSFGYFFLVFLVDCKPFHRLFEFWIKGEQKNK